MAGCKQTLEVSDNRRFKEDDELLYKDGIEHGKTGTECEVILMV